MHEKYYYTNGANRDYILETVLVEPSDCSCGTDRDCAVADRDLVCYRACVCGAPSGCQQSRLPPQREFPAHLWLPWWLNEALCTCLLLIQAAHWTSCSGCPCV